MKLLREIVGAAASFTLLVLAFGYAGQRDLADEYIRGAMEKEMRPQRVRAYNREFLCDCLKVHRGEWLRLQVVQQPDKNLCNAVCVYDDGTVTEGTL